MEKKKSVILILALLVFVFFASLVISKNLDRTGGGSRRPGNSGKITDHTFDFKLIKEANKDAKKNYLISPYSIKIALNMLKDGANNESYKQIDEVLKNNKFNIVKDDAVSIANGLFVRNAFRKTVNKDYINNLKKNYKADVVFDKFESPEIINNWVKEKTKDMIPYLLDDIDSNFVLALVNALAIDVKWEQAFSCKNTMEENFHKEDGSEVKVAMMKDYNSIGKYFKTDLGEGIILPYKGSKNKGLELIAILPNDSISEYVNKLDDKELNKIDDYKVKGDKEIHLSFPKFTYDYEWGQFMSSLKDMGIKDIFDPKKADLSKMLKPSGEKFYVSEAIHKTHIELDEKGTKAAAATGFVVSKNAVSEKEVINIKFNKPFVYLIRDKGTKEILFFGALYEPNKWEGNDCNEDEK